MNDMAKEYGAEIQNFVHQSVHLTLEQVFAMMDHIPLCINVLNDKAESLYCNAFTVNLYNIGSKEKYLENFYKLTPQNQPNGKSSEVAFCEYIEIAKQKGETHFNWLDTKYTGEELPLYISIYRLNVRDENGNGLMVSVMQDLSPQLAGDDEDTTHDEYYHNRITYKALFNTVAELAEEWFWIYDVNMATIQFFGKGREILGLASEKQPFPSYVVNAGMVYPDDLDTFLAFDNNLKIGVEEPVEVRFIQPSGISKYYRITYKTTYNQDGRPMFSIGKTYDIDKQKRLEVLSKTDLLTNCLNKITTENIIKDTLLNSPSSSHALFLIDVDDFKSVNDQLGHYFGDITLSDIAKNLYANFRGVDIIGRIGGDEFLVFVKDISDMRVIQSKAEAIANAFKNSYSGEKKDYKVSGSIGVALYPAHADSYEGLYKCADKALYSSKLAGKDRYTIYSDELADANTKTLTEVDNANKPVNNFFDSGITSMVFDLMYLAEDVSTSMDTVLRLLGTHMGVDRCYVAQTFDKGDSYSMTYEWRAGQIASKKIEFQNISTGDIKDFFAELEQNGVMYNRDIDIVTKTDAKQLPGFESALSYLLVQTKGRGHARLVLGLDDYHEHRVWSEKEINTVQYILKMVSIFISSSARNTEG